MPVAGAGLLIALLTAAITFRHGRPFFVDDSVHGWAVHHRPPTARELAIAITSTGIGIVPYALAAAAGMIAGTGVRGKALMAAQTMAFLLVVQTLRFGVATTAGRPRPPVSDWAVHVSGFAFPSGHTVASATAAGLLIWAACQRLHGALRAAVGSCAAVWAIAVGLTRVYLGVHWPTDVAGGWLFTITALGLAVWFTRRLPRPGG